MDKFESSIFRNAESLQGSSELALTCEPKDLQAFRDAWIAISTDPKFQRLFRGETSYLKEIEDAMKAKPFDPDMQEFQKALGNTISTHLIENQQQRDSLDYMKLTGAGMNLFRRIGKGQIDEVNKDQFGQAAVEALKDRLLIAYDGKITTEQLSKKIELGGEVLNQALAGEQTDICSAMIKSPPGLVLMGYPEILTTQDMAKDMTATKDTLSGIRLTFQLAPKYYLDEADRKDLANQYPTRLGFGGYNFQPTKLGGDVGNCKPLRERADGSWVVELKGGIRLGKTPITVLTKEHLAGRKLNAGEELPGFTTAMTEKRRNEVAEKQSRSANGQEESLRNPSYETALARSGTVEEMQKYLKSIGTGDDPNKMSNDFFIGEHGTEKEMRSYLASGRVDPALQHSSEISGTVSTHSSLLNDRTSGSSEKSSSTELTTPSETPAPIAPAISGAGSSETTVPKQQDTPSVRPELTNENLDQFVKSQQSARQRVEAWLGNDGTQPMHDTTPDRPASESRRSSIDSSSTLWSNSSTLVSSSPTQEKVSEDLGKPTKTMEVSPRTSGLDRVIKALDALIATEEATIQEIAKSEGKKMGAKIMDATVGDKIENGRLILGSESGDRVYVHRDFEGQQNHMRVLRFSADRRHTLNEVSVPELANMLKAAEKTPDMKDPMVKVSGVVKDTSGQAPVPSNKHTRSNSH